MALRFTGVATGTSLSKELPGLRSDARGVAGGAVAMRGATAHPLYRLNPSPVRPHSEALSFEDPPPRTEGTRSPRPSKIGRGRVRFRWWPRYPR